MRRINRLIIALSIAGLPLPAIAQSSQVNPVTQAMMETYQKLLTQNPKDYDTYLKRAAEYYRYGKYALALNDVNQAIKFTPKSDTDMKSSELNLRANIYSAMGNNDLALADINSAIELKPQDYMALCLRANMEYEQGRYDDAKADYQRLCRIDSRSLDGLFGLAQVAAKANDTATANGYADQAVDCATTQSEAYRRRAIIRQMLGNDTGAINDLVTAMSTDTGDRRILQEILKLSDTNCEAVLAGLGDAITKAPENGAYRYLRAAIAKRHFRYKTALVDFEALVGQKLYESPGLHQSMAQCLYALGQYQKAADQINTALNDSPDDASSLVTRADILRAMNEPTEAMKAVDKALSIDPKQPEALALTALLPLDMGRTNEAYTAIEQAMSKGQSVKLKMIAAWLNKDLLKKPNSASALYKSALSDASKAVPATDYNIPFALLNSGKTDEATGWIENRLATSGGNDGQAEYYAACFYAQAGDTAKALQMAEKALSLGYSDYHGWTRHTDAGINVGPLRGDDRFNRLLDQYKFLF